MQSYESFFILDSFACLLIDISPISTVRSAFLFDTFLCLPTALILLTTRAASTLSALRQHRRTLLLPSRCSLATLRSLKLRVRSVCAPFINPSVLILPRPSALQRTPVVLDTLCPIYNPVRIVSACRRRSIDTTSATFSALSPMLLVPLLSSQSSTCALGTPSQSPFGCSFSAMPHTPPLQHCRPAPPPQPIVARPLRLTSDRWSLPSVLFPMQDHDA
ncbi:hypothetical protein C8R43DRAFT_1208776 [Mycena crocata]|nr:hypothetical protein C8R43DRAFT_1208776 [Mycena crocata]